MLLIIILLLIIIINLMNVYFRKENFENINNNVKDCIVEWDNNYGPCSASCGGGTQELGYKVLQNPEDGYWNGIFQNANQCPQKIKRACNEQPCPIDCEGVWGPWSPCQKEDGTPAKCGGGKRSRSYNITQPAVRGYIDGVLTPGTACPHKHGDIQEEACNVKPCAIDCVGGWGNYGSCNKDNGKKTRTYKVTTPAQDGYIYNTDEVMEYDQAKPCDYTHDQTMSIDCNVDCEYNWGAWNVNKNNGTQTRYPVISVDAKNGGVACPNSETKIANVDCVGKWVDNGECEDYWKKQKYTITQQEFNAGKPCPHYEGKVRTLRPGIHTCKEIKHKRCKLNTWLGCAIYDRWTTYTPNGL